MLGVTFTSWTELIDKETTRKKGKKEKKKKKEKSNKKDKHEKRAASHSSDKSDAGDDGGRSPTKSSDDIQDAGMGAIDSVKKSAVEEPLLLREDWMTKSMKRETPNAAHEAEEERQEEEERRKQAAESEVVAGLQVMKKPHQAGQLEFPGQGTAAAGGGRGPGGGGGLVGDGGASWRLKALRRAQEQARAEGRSLQEVVGERWGSLAQLTGDLSATVAADGKAHLRAAAERRRAAIEGSPAVVPHYLQDVRTDRGKMLRPAEDASFGWRRDRDRDREGHGRRDDRAGDRIRSDDPTGPDGRDRDAGRRGRGGRDGDRDLDRDIQHEREREGEGRHASEAHDIRGLQRDRDDRRRQQGDSREPRPSNKGADGVQGAGAGEDRTGFGVERDGRRDRDDGDRGPDREDRERDPGDQEQDRGDRGRHRGDQERDRRNRERDREGDRGRGRGQEREWERNDRGRDSGRGGASAGPRPSKEQAAALQQLAGSLNAFRDDGSFMEQFLDRQEGRQPQGLLQQLRGSKERGLGAQGKPARHGNDRDRDGAYDRDRNVSPHDHTVDQAGDKVPGGTQANEPRNGGRGGGGEGPAGPGPSSSGAAGVAGGSVNRGVAALLRARTGPQAAQRDAVDAAADGSGGDGGDGVDLDGLEPTASRRAPLFVGGGESDAGPNRGPGGSSSRGGGGGGAALGNKSAAELLRARLKGLPPPTSTDKAGEGAVATVKPEPVDRNGKPGRRDVSLGVGADDYDASDGGGDGDGGSGGGKPRREVVQLPLVDAQGRAVRGAFGREAAGAGTAPNAGRRAGTKPPERYNRQTGEKERYFADDDKVDLQTMLRRAKYGDDDMDMDEHLAINIAKKRKFRGTELDVDAEYDYDGGLEMYESRSKRGNAEAQRNRERSRQVTDLRRQAAAEAGCMLCLNNPNRPKHLAIALGTCAYLSLPHRGRLVRGHCCISPSEHCPSIRGLDEAAWTEVKNFIKCLIRMYGAQGQSVIFMETYMTRSGGRHHAVLDAIPVTERQLEKARGYFKKAILEAESEWSTHHAKACIETSAQKGLRESIPPNFPYFYVQFGYGSGYVHVIDNETKFDPNFGRQVLIGLLDLPPEMAYQRQKAESLATQKHWVREFEALWDPYDWTRQLDAA